MSIKHSLASKERWNKIPKEERSARMAALAKHKAAKTSKKKLREHSLMMVAKRVAKRKSV